MNKQQLDLLSIGEEVDENGIRRLALSDVNIWE